MSNEYLIQKSTLDSLATGAARLRGARLPLSTANMISEINGANTDLATEEGLIDQIITVLESKGATTGGYAVTIICQGDAEYGNWLSYSIDGGLTYHDVPANDTTPIYGVTKIRFSWDPDAQAEAGVFYGGTYNEDLDEYEGVTNVQRDIDIVLTADTTFRTYWMP